MENLSWTITNMFRPIIEFSHCHCNYRNPEPSFLDVWEHTKMMTVPTTGESFEIPSFLTTRARLFDKDALVVNLNSWDYVPRYVSVANALGQALVEEFPTKRLIKVKITKLDIPYYATKGAIFDAEFNPLIMAVWKVERSLVDPNQILFQKPILRVSPKCFIENKDPVQRYVVQKILKCTLETKTMDEQGNEVQIAVAIEDCPYTITKAAPPNVYTTSEQLRQAAIGHL